MGEDNNTALKRRNSIPSAVILPIISNRKHYHKNNPTPPQATFLAADFDLISLKHPLPDFELISLRDILPSSPSSILSPTPPATLAGISSSSLGSGYEISIRNRLVKQAAWAYLQPAVLSSPSSSSRWKCFSGEIFTAIIADFRRVVSETLSRVYDWLVDALWLILCR